MLQAGVNHPVLAYRRASFPLLGLSEIRRASFSPVGEQKSTPRRGSATKGTSSTSALAHRSPGAAARAQQGRKRAQASTPPAKQEQPPPCSWGQGCFMGRQGHSQHSWKLPAALDAVGPFLGHHRDAELLPKTCSSTFSMASALKAAAKGNLHSLPYGRHCPKVPQVMPKMEIAKQGTPVELHPWNECSGSRTPPPACPERNTC